ncbi:hypothetical protein Glove_123g91 [Diversispora epigaea]|uniref:ribonuclease H n=1 Tax=Diversispora epigaea TaxID=1348612 RepID=A0A397J3B8_9GLOM|nr:hypothetical protein Glove_123g91 [Diversispora epigaea]
MGISLAGEVVIPKGKYEPVRYLGIWLSEYGDKTYQKSLIKNTVIQAVRTMLNKAITDKQCRYIINQVILPKIEYLLTDTILGKGEGEKLNSKLRMLFKHKCSLSRTIINSVVYSQLGYNMFNILDRQTQMHAKEITHRINRQDLVGITTKIRLQQLQNRMWDPEEIYNKKVIGSVRNKQLKSNLSAHILNIMGEKGITLQKTKLEDLPHAPGGGAYDLKSFMEDREWYNRNRDSLRRRGVMFLEQLMNADLTQCIPWQQINGRPSKGVQPRWYKEVVEEFHKKKNELAFQDVINPFNTLRRVNENEIKRFQTIVTKKETDIIYGLVSRNPKNKKTERENRKKTNNISGNNGNNNNNSNSSNKQDRRDITPSLIIQHLIKETINGEERSPLVPCEGCDLRDTTPLRDSRVSGKNEAKKCLIRTDIKQIRSVPARQRIVSSTHKEDKRIKRRLLISPKSIKIYFENSLNTESIGKRKDTSVYTTHKNLLIKEEIMEKKINKLQAELSHYTQITFYTDGSLLTNQKGERGEDKMGIGLAISPEGYDERILEFSARVTGPASSTRAELWAILMALELAPPNKKIKIYTDSASAIAAIKRFMVDKWGRKIKDLKNPNVLQAISDKCNGKRIIFELNKVEAHAGVFLNEKADHLAREGADSQEKENSLHPFKCQGYDSTITNKLIQQLAIIGINQGSKKKKAELVVALQKESFMRIDVGRKLRGTVESDHFSLVDMMRGLVYKHMRNRIKTIITTDTNKVKEIQKQILSFLKNILKRKWEERCDLFLKWEKENEIHRLDKRENKVGKESRITNHYYKSIKETLLMRAKSIKETFISESYRVATPFINKFFCIDNSGVVTY